MTISSIFSPIAAFLKSSFLRLSALDGKPGLSTEDFEIVLLWVRSASSASNLNNQARAKVVKDLVTDRFGDKVPSWIVEVLVWLAYSYAKRKGFLP